MTPPTAATCDPVACLTLSSSSSPRSAFQVTLSSTSPRRHATRHAARDAERAGGRTDGRTSEQTDERAAESRVATNCEKQDEEGGAKKRKVEAAVAAHIRNSSCSSLAQRQFKANATAAIHIVQHKQSLLFCCFQFSNFEHVEKINDTRSTTIQILSLNLDTTQLTSFH